MHDPHAPAHGDPFHTHGDAAEPASRRAGARRRSTAAGASDFDPFAVPRPAGHNRPGAAQWQTPHDPDAQVDDTDATGGEPDIDLVEKAFTESFIKASDPVSFLRLAGIALVGRDAAGTELSLLRVTQENRVDVGSLTPQFGGERFRYDPLPATMTSMRERLAFIYFDGETTRNLDFSQARRLEPVAA